MSAPDEKLAGLPSHPPNTQHRGSLSSSETAHKPDDRYNEKREDGQQGILTDISKEEPQASDADVETAKSAGPTSESEAEANYQPKSIKFWLIILSTLVSMLLVALDRTIVSTAIPRITDEFKSLGDIGWYGSSYMLTAAAFQLLWGRIYKFYDLRWAFISCILIFEVGSAICGAAPNSPVFIVGRAIAGVGAAGIMTGSMMTIIPLVPLHKRPIFQSLFAMVFGVASISGPLLGGAFTERATWRWCFYMNLPAGVVAFACLFFFFKSPEKPKQSTPVKEQIIRLDPLGTFFFIPCTVCLLLALQWGGSAYAWSNWRIILLFVMFGLAGIAFAVVQVKMPDSASLPVRIITQRTMLSGTFYMLFLSGAMIVMVYFIPLWFQTTQAADPVKSGIYTIPLVLSLVVAGIISSVLTQKSGYYVPSMILSPCIMAVGEGLLSTFTPTTGSPHWIAYQFLTGFGVGFGMQTISLAVQAVLPKADVSMGLAITFFAQQLGGAIFVSVGQTILSSLLVSRLSNIPGLDPIMIISSGATELHQIVPAEYMPTVIDAYNHACTRIFLATVALTCAQLLCAFGVQWRSIKKDKNPQAQ